MSGITGFMTEDILERARTIAVVGLSTSPFKDAHLDIVNVFRPAAEAAGIAQEAAAIGAGALWLQLGIRSAEAARIAAAAGMDYVEDRCIAVDARMYGVRRSA